MDRRAGEVGEARAVGLIAGAYEYIDRFDDVNGWDLPHARRVRWFRLPDEYDFGRPVFAGRHRFARVQVPDVLDYAQRFVDSPPVAWQRAPLPDLPDEEPALRGGGFDSSDDEYAHLVGRVLDEEIGRGEGSNFVIHRVF